jgi:hypothetical protein
MKQPGQPGTEVIFLAECLVQNEQKPANVDAGLKFVGSVHD